MESSGLRSARVSVIIPTLNEEKTVFETIDRLKNVGCSNILVIDGHSKDCTVELARKLGANVIFQNGKGKGGALRQAFQESLGGDVIAIMDADGSMSPEELGLFVGAVEKGADVVKGSRFLPCGGSDDMTPMRRVGNRILTGVFNFLFLTRYTDLCYGYMAFRKEALGMLSSNLKSNNFEIETEICVKSRILGLRVLEVPSFERARLHGASKLNTFGDGFRILALILRESLTRQRVSSD